MEILKVDEASDVVVGGVAAFFVSAVLGDADTKVVRDAYVEISRTAAEDVDVEVVFVGGHEKLLALRAGSSFLASLGMRARKARTQQQQRQIQGSFASL